jgi:uncharacterized protein (TIGR02246 family)
MPASLTSHELATTQVATPELAANDRAELEQVVAHLESSWNVWDGDAFAEPFAADADFVNIRGEHMRSRPAIAAGHDRIFRTIYAGSSVRMTLEAARLLRNEVALAHVDSLLLIPAGPMAGSLRARFSIVLTKGNAGWEIAAFHNTIQMKLGAALPESL